jgi:hypothetical protein
MARPPGRRTARGPRLDRSRAAVARCGGEAVLLDLRTYRATRANAVAARVIALADGTRTASAIARVVAADFAVAPARARADVRRLLDALDRRGFLRRGGGPVGR